MSSIKMNGELVPLSKEVLFPSDKSETALVDMQRGQCRRKPPIYGQTLLHITLTTSREKTEWSESQPPQPSRCCRNPWKTKPVRFSGICRYIRNAVKLRGPFFFACFALWMAAAESLSPIRPCSWDYSAASSIWNSSAQQGADSGCPTVRRDGNFRLRLT